MCDMTHSHAHKLLVDQAPDKEDSTGFFPPMNLYYKDDVKSIGKSIRTTSILPYNESNKWRGGVQFIFSCLILKVTEFY